MDWLKSLPIAPTVVDDRGREQQWFGTLVLTVTLEGGEPIARAELLDGAYGRVERLRITRISADAIHKRASREAYDSRRWQHWHLLEAAIARVLVTE